VPLGRVAEDRRHARPYIGAVRDKVRRLPGAGMERAAGIDERQTAHTVGATPARPINLGQRDRHEKGSVLHPQLGAAGDDEDQSQEQSGSLHSPVISVSRKSTRVCARSHPSHGRRLATRGSWLSGLSKRRVCLFHTRIPVANAFPKARMSPHARCGAACLERPAISVRRTRSLVLTFALSAWRLRQRSYYSCDRGHCTTPSVQVKALCGSDVPLGDRGIAWLGRRKMAKDLGTMKHSMWRRARRAVTRTLSRRKLQGFWRACFAKTPSQRRSGLFTKAPY